MSALIYAAIVVLWAYFLVPMWLRRGDPAASTDPLSSAVRVLARRPTRPAPAPSPGRPSPERPDMPSHPRAASSTKDCGTLGPSAGRLARRRRVLLGLLVAQLATVALGLGGVLPAWTGLLVLVPLAAYVTHLRAQARREADSPRRSVPVPAPRPPAVPPAPARPSAPTAPVAPPTPPAPREPQLFDLLAVEAAEAARNEAETIARRPPAADTWTPVRVPPPTYVIKPRAPIRPLAPGAGDGGSRRRPDGDGPQRAVND